MNKILLHAAVLAVSFAASAHASDERPVWDWNGVYMGAHAGWVGSDVRWTDNTGNWWAPPGFTHSASDNGFIGGGQVGILRQQGNIVGGLELSVSGASGGTRAASPFFPAIDTYKTEIDTLVSVTGRLGYAFGDWLPYVQGGYAGGMVSMRNTSGAGFFGCAVPCVYDSSQWQHGFTLGGGVDYRISDNIALGVNYRYANLGNHAYIGVTGNAGTLENFKVGADVHAVTARANWLFGDQGSSIASRDAPAAAPAWDWNAIYLGVHGGLGHGDIDWTDNLGGWFTNFAGNSYMSSGDGVTGGVQLGMLTQWDHVVGGIGVSLSAMSLETRETSPFFPPSDTLETKVDLLATVTARIGYAFGSLLPYVEGGYAGGNVSVTNTDRLNCFPAACLFDTTKWHHGFTLGGGLDYRVTENLVLGLNYSYVSLGDATHSGTTTNTFGVPEDYTVGADVHAVTLRANWLFDGTLFSAE
ncbi:outer membrane beta-barrel protein [Breoghania sp. L-A4]|uniref:outer membrane protein n=1 Tax=Breoghania sp. L-A4 TaxID=2304600 RepID=UPI000E35F7B4|nr:outer membrane beta-barrel protein [Breoghania sp. L-A4]AXS39895.1 porin family protein [Breoghania sp. L-A4]